MNTTLSTKIAALMLALAMNSVIMGGVALMFNAGSHQSSLHVASNGAVQIERSAA
jgi:hypothetical protein